ncbi:hypothetical protein HUJ04_000170 [Dendroctonus ponderosae]|nr:hypothetical protein HUJ04_000170 [Dendroctonus ponderosae]
METVKIVQKVVYLVADSDDGGEGAGDSPTMSPNSRRGCVRPPHFDILWLPRAAIRSVEGDPSDCILVVGVSRPRMALAVLLITLLSLFLTVHLIYDSALSSLHQQGAAPPTRPPFYLLPRKLLARPTRRLPQVGGRGMGAGPMVKAWLLQAIIMGVRKCGTRALLEMLYLHPAVQKAAGEVHFFDRDENYYKGLEWYRQQMPHSRAGQVTIEKSPSYFVTPEVSTRRPLVRVDFSRYLLWMKSGGAATCARGWPLALCAFHQGAPLALSPTVPERIRAMNASIKLLLIVREPVTRAISDYTQLRANAATMAPTAPTLGPVRSFEQLALHRNGTVNESYRPLAISVYHRFLHRWLEPPTPIPTRVIASALYPQVFPREQLLVVNGDQLIDDPLPQLQRIERFLGLEPRISAHNFYFNETKGFFCLRNETADRCLRETKGRRHPRVSPHVVAQLRAYFDEHNQKFYELIGEDLAWPSD